MKSKLQNPKSKHNVKLILLLIPLLLFGLVSAASADIYVAQGQEIEIKVPSRDLSVERYYVASEKEPQKILRFGKLDKKDKDTRQAKVDARKWEPGLYNVHYISGEAAQKEILFISPPVYYGSNKLSSVLRQALYFSDRNDKEALRYFAKKRDLDLQDENLMVNVELRINESKRGEIIKFIADLGGGIKNFSADLLNIRVPLAALNTITKNQDVHFVYLIDKGDSDWVIATSEGVEDLKANLWHLAGYKGEGIKIAVVDSGFAKYGQSIARGELPPNLIAKSFDPDYEIGAGSDQHGVECAEIIYDIAPAAQLYLLYADESNSTTDELVDYLVEEGIDIVSRSQSYYRGPFDGTSKRSQLINKAKEAGIVWVNSAGNRAKTHWEGFFNPTGNMEHQWNGSDTRMAIEHAAVKFRLAWNDWGQGKDGYPTGNAHGQDLKLNLYCDGILVDSSDNDQSNPAVDPYEQLKFAAYAGDYEIEIVANNYDPAFPIYLELFHHGGGSFEYAMPQSSVSIGGDAKGAITVGAVKVYSHEFQDYSSQGPTNGINSGPPDLNGGVSLIKPDVCGATETQTSISFFGGTSAATPHIAGLAALVKQYLSSNGQNEVAPDEVKNYLETHTKKLLGVAEKNNQTGSGLVVLDDQKVIAGIVPPESEGPIIYDASFINSFPSHMILGLQYVWGKNIRSGAELKFLGTTKPTYYYLAKDKYTGLVQIAVHQPKASADAKLGIEEIEVTNFDGKSAKFDKYEILPAFKTLYLDSIKPEMITPGFEGDLVFKAGPYIGNDFKEGVEITFAPKIEVDKENIAILDPKTLIVPIKVPYDFYNAHEISYLIKNPGGGFAGSDYYSVQESPKIELSALPVPDQINPVSANLGWKGEIGAYRSEGLKVGSLLDFGKGINLDPNLYTYEFDAWIYVQASVAQDAEFGFRNVTVYDPNGYVGTLEAGFKIVPLIPEIWSVLVFDLPGEELIKEYLPVEWEGWFGIWAENVKEGAVVSLGKGIEIKVYDYAGLQNLGCPHFKVKIYISPDTSPGIKDLVVTNPDGGSAIYKNVFEVLLALPPSIKSVEPIITSINPASAPRGWSGKLIVNGSGFQKGANFSFYGGGAEWVLVKSSSYESATKLVADIVISNEEKAIGSKHICVKNPDGKSVYKSYIFEVTEEQKPASIISVSPSVLYQGDSLSFTIESDKLGFSKDIAPTLNIPGISVIGDPVVSDDLKKATFQIQVDPQLQVYGGLADVKVKIGDKEIVGEKMLTIKSPSLVSVTPAQAKQGETIEIEVAGEGTHFGPNTQVHVTPHWGGEDLPPADWVGDISTASNVQVVSPTKVKATFKISDDAHLSKRNVGVSTPDINGTGKAEVLWLNEAFEITPK